jgi:hypothetical protein
MVAYWLPAGAARWWLPALAVLPAIAWWTPTLELSYLSLTVHSAVILAGASTLAASLLTPAWNGAARRPADAGVVVVLAAGLVALSLAHGPPPSAERPRVDSLFLLQDTSTGEATWRSLDPSVDRWTAAWMGPSPERRRLPEVLEAGDRTVLTSPAGPVAALPATVEIELDERPEGGSVARRVVIRVRPGHGSSLRLWVRAEVGLEAASVDGRPVPVDEQGELRLSVHGVAADGVALQIELADRWPLQVDVVDLAFGLPAGRGPERPPGFISRPGWWSDTTMVWSTHTL